MCTPQSELQSIENIEMTGQEEVLANGTGPRTKPLCKTDEPADKRLLLLTLAAPSHGSTALEGVLMSSRNVATLCAERKWQCEGNEIMKEHGYDRDSLEHWNFTEMLNLYSDIWDLEKP